MENVVNGVQSTTGGDDARGVQHVLTVVPFDGCDRSESRRAIAGRNGQERNKGCIIKHGHTYGRPEGVHKQNHVSGKGEAR